MNYSWDHYKVLPSCSPGTTGYQQLYKANQKNIQMVLEVRAHKDLHDRKDWKQVHTKLVPTRPVLFAYPSVVRSHSGVARNWLSSFNSLRLSFWYKLGVSSTSNCCTSASVKGIHVPYNVYHPLVGTQLQCYIAVMHTVTCMHSTFTIECNKFISTSTIICRCIYLSCWWCLNHCVFFWC